MVCQKIKFKVAIIQLFWLCLWKLMEDLRQNRQLNKRAADRIVLF